MNGLTLFKEGGTGGEVYQGEYKKGFKEGYGHQMLQGGESYFGGWRRDAKSDEGVAVSQQSDGARYVGAYEKDEKHGYGTTYRTDHSVMYKGNWRFDLPDDQTGEAIQYENCTTTDGAAYYQGPFQAGERHGPKGTLYYADGSIKYEGRWVNDEMDDEVAAVFRSKDGSTYRGPFQANLRHGEGVYTDRYGNQEKKKFENGKDVTGSEQV